MNKKKRKKLEKVLLIITAILLISLGATALLKGNLHYYNFWGGAVFAPIAIVIGALVLIIAIFKFENFNTTWKKKHN